MPFKKFRTIDIGSIAAGATAERSWEFDEDLVLRRIFFVEKAGSSMNAVEATIRLDGVMLTDEYVPVVLLSHLNQLNPEINKPVEKGSKIVLGIKNNEAGSRNIYAVLELWSGGE